MFKLINVISTEEIFTSKFFAVIAAFLSYGRTWYKEAVKLSSEDLKSLYYAKTEGNVEMETAKLVVK